MLVLQYLFKLPMEEARVGMIFAGGILLFVVKRTIDWGLDGRSVRHFEWEQRISAFMLVMFGLVLTMLSIASPMAALFLILRNHFGFNPFDGIYTFDDLLGFFQAPAEKAAFGNYAGVLGVGGEGRVKVRHDAGTAFGVFLFLYDRFIAWGMGGTVAVAFYLLIGRWLAKGTRNTVS